MEKRTEAGKPTTTPHPKQKRNEAEGESGAMPKMK
jgi:hypothetical protein